MARSGGGGLVTTNPPTYTTGTENSLSLDTSGNLRVTGTVTSTPSGTQNVSITGEPSNTRSDTYTMTGTGVTVNATTYVAQSYSIEVQGTNSPATSWTVVLEGSIDNSTYTTLMTHNTTIGDSTILISGANLYPMLYFRSRCTALVLGPATNIVVTITGKG